MSMTEPPTSDVISLSLYLFVFIRLHALSESIFLFLLNWNPFVSTSTCTPASYPGPRKCFQRKFQIRTIHLRTR